MPKVSLSAEAFSHTPPGLWTAKGLLHMTNLRGLRLALAERGATVEEADQPTRSETEMELVLLGKEAHRADAE